jgi:hypothetical protein
MLLARTRTSAFSNAWIESNALTMTLSWLEPARDRTHCQKSAQDARFFPQAKLEFLRFAYIFVRKNYIPDLPPAEEFALVPSAGALLDGDLPLPPLSPVGFDPLLDPVVPLPGLRPVGFDPLLEPEPVAGLALPAGGTLPGAIPGAT